MESSQFKSCPLPHCPGLQKRLGYEPASPPDFKGTPLDFQVFTIEMFSTQ